MVRYRRSDELYHYGRSKKDGAPGVGTGNWRRKNRGSMYKYADGTPTPLGRLSKGDDLKDKTGAEKISAYVKAARDTAAGYGLIRYSESSSTTQKTVKGGGKLKKAIITKQQEKQRKEDEARAKAAYEERTRMRAEAEAKAKEAAERVQKVYQEKLEEQRKAAEERENAEREAREARDAKSREEWEARRKEATELKERLERESAQRQSQKNVNKAKQNRWEDFSDEDLEKYARRVDLEARATEALLKKMDAPRQIINEIAQYGQTAVTAYNNYKNLFETISAKSEVKVPSYADMVRDNTVKAIQEKFGVDATAEKFDIGDLNKYIDIIDKINKLAH